MDALKSWQEEKQSAYLYRVLAESEPDERRSGLFTKLAGAAEEQALLWARKLEEQGAGEPPVFQPGPRARVAVRLVKRLGPQRVRPVLSALKVRGLSVYKRGLVDLEHPLPRSVGDIGERHAGQKAGGNLRAAVFGMNDGLISNASLIMGMAGATEDPGIVMLSGLAGLMAGAFSMAAGEYVSVRSQTEFHENQIALERAELELYPEEEAEELALIYNARGMPLERAREFASRLLEDPETALDTLSREELGLDPDDLGSPWGAALYSFLSFAAGAMIPVLPFLFGAREAGLTWTMGLTAAALFTVGCALSLFTGRGLLYSGIRMLGIGAAAGLVTFVIGSAIGAGFG